MKAGLLTLLGCIGLLLATTRPAAAQSITLEFKDGKVNLVTQNVPVSTVLAEWARRGKTTIINGERVPGPPATLQLMDVPEEQALDILLRGASGYLMAARETPSAGASIIDRILILPTSRVTNAQQQVLLPPSPQAQPAIQEDVDDGPVPGPGQRTNPNFPPGVGVGPTNPPPGVTLQNLPPGVRVPGQPPITEEPEVRPAPAPTNPFGVAPGTAQPGVIAPAPAPAPPRQR
jgi:hypothetical protein